MSTLAARRLAAALFSIAGCASSTAPTRGSPAMPSVTPAVPAGFTAAPVVTDAIEGPARLVVDAPLPDSLAKGLVVIRYRTENLRIMPVFGLAALAVSPRLGHLHITLDGAPWHWVDASGEPIIVQWLPPGPHAILVELADPTHHVIDSATVRFEIPETARR